MASTTTKVLVYPLAPDNPYQRLLYDALLKTKSIEVKTILIPTTLPGFLFEIFTITFQLMVSRAAGFRLIHVHWLYQLGFPGKPIFPWLSRAISSLQIRLFLFECKILGYKIIWTVHDVLPHYKLTLNDTAMSQNLLNSSIKLITLSTATLDKLDGHNLTYDAHKIAVIPHGNYIGSYPNTVSKSAARQQLNIPGTAFVYLFFGTVLPYKNAGGMLDAFEKIVEQHPNSVLVIAGRATDPELRTEILAAERRIGDALRLHLDFIDDKDVQNYFNSADIVVFPYLRITNSGTALLAASFAKPVIAPILGAFMDLPKESGIFYQAGSQTELEEAMLQAPTRIDDLEAMSVAADTYARSLSWDTIADQTYDLYQKALDD